jgi:putative transposase
MKQHRAYKFRLKTNRPEFHRFAGICRWVWNEGVKTHEARYAAGEKFLGYVDMSRELTEWKKAHPFLRIAPSHCLQNVLKDLDKAYREFFKGTRKRPRFHKRGKCVDSFRESDAKVFAIDSTNGRIKFPKLGWIRYRKSQEVDGTPKNCTIKREGGHWYVCIQVEAEVPEPAHPAREVSVGIDLGVRRFATLSDGSVFVAPNPFKRMEQRLARAQRRLSRKVKFSENWKKQKARVARIQERIAHARRDFLHKTSTEIAKTHGTVVIENLQVSNMTRSAKGDAENPGSNVCPKSGLNRRILDQGWGEFRRQLEYKQVWLGGEVVAVPPQYTSQGCSKCGRVDPVNRPSVARFKCCKCGFQADPDHNAAINILAAGLAASACGGAPVADPVKQEPTPEVVHEAA